MVLCARADECQHGDVLRAFVRRFFFVGRLGSLSAHCGYFKAVAVKQSFQKKEEKKRDEGLPSTICKTNCREIITPASQSHVCRLAAVTPKDGK